MCLAMAETTNVGLSTALGRSYNVKLYIIYVQKYSLNNNTKKQFSE